MTINEYIAELNNQHRTGIAREHSYRPALQQLLSSLLPNCIVTNEPARSDCGAPDYIITTKTDNLPIAFLEAKDINDDDLDGRRNHKEQFTRYKISLDTIIFTDYLDFHLYQHGDWIDNVRLAEVSGGKIVLIKQNIEKFKGMISHLETIQPQRITSANKLAEQMAQKAKLLAECVNKSFEQLEKGYGNRQLQGQYNAFKHILIHDLTTSEFADIYAQTVAYGMFVARLHDQTPETFSRQEAAELIPRTNPFLRQIFQQIAGYELDERISWVIDDLVATFRATNVNEIMSSASNDILNEDPTIHFYEDFLAAYDPSLRKAKGVWYTPQPVVSFIVNAVDELLQSEFGLPMGLADYSKTKKRVQNIQYTGRKGEKREVEAEFHRVHVLDPATGTGTFLAEVIRKIYSKFSGMQGMWQSYVAEHLLPRISGFEILMASYAIAHMKLDMILEKTGYNHSSNERLRVYLTNSLEECDRDTGSLFANWLSDEAMEANIVKRDNPVMVMLGNPPYSGVSSNNGEWITSLLEDYKTEPGGKDRLKERKIWLNDDYVKFIRLAQYFVEKNGEGILAYINNNGFLDNPTFRGMRWQLLDSFDDIYILNLHGNSMKKETAPDGSKDENVFDITVGTSINIFVKKGKKAQGELAKVHYTDLYGLRDSKYEYLSKHTFSSIGFQNLSPTAPYFFFIPKDDSGKEEYDKGIKLSDIMPTNVMGIVSMGDSFAYSPSKDMMESKMIDLLSTNYTEEAFTEKYNLGKNYSGFILDSKRKGLTFDSNKLTQVLYRPFDVAWTYYDGKVIWRAREDVLKHMLKPNLGLCAIRINSRDNEHTYCVSNTIIDKTLLSSKDNANIFPLYLYQSDGSRTVNFNQEIIEAIIAIVGDSYTPESLFYYIVGILYSTKYRDTYKSFLKVDYPNIPYPTSPEYFRTIADKGERLCNLQLMIDSYKWDCTTLSFPIVGDNIVTSYKFESGKIYINDTQYFGNVPMNVWNFYLGGYQPAQKWLKDRKNRQLSFEDIRHYFEIIYALENTMRIMEEIDQIIEL